MYIIKYHNQNGWSICQYKYAVLLLIHCLTTQSLVVHKL